MSLKAYRKKRKFGLTSEPEGAEVKPRPRLRFVVQEHHASHLHYDFRLELGGVLKSWAVPKGPSLNPRIKRLAVMVEDHPLDYIDFEGSIPEGNYGAGQVKIWDRGIFYDLNIKDPAGTEKKLLRDLKKGKMSFFVFGHKLKGEFNLIKSGKGKDNWWLLMKKADEFAKKDGEAVSVPDLPRSPMPHFIKPMLARLIDEPFNQDGWIFEIKWDGYRAIAEIDQKINLYSRNLLSFNSFDEIIEDLKKIKHKAILDGELVVLDSSGMPRFHLMQNYRKGGEGALMYYVFDLIYLDGQNLSSLPLKKRKRILKIILPKNLKHIKFSVHIEKNGINFFKAVKALGLEGMMAKEENSPYIFGRRTGDWLKIKTQARQEAVIAGYTKPRGSRRYLGALVLGIYRGNKLEYIGHTGGGFDNVNLEELFKKLQALKQDKSPFESPPATNTPVQWVKPKLICEVKFSEWTESGVMRQPIFLGLREDKEASEVEKELPADPADIKRAAEDKSAKSHRIIKIGNHELKLTNLDKIFWPEDEFSKGDMIDYYSKASPYILRYLNDRPQSLNRHPNGIYGESFFQKDVAAIAPKWAKTVAVYSESNKKNVKYLVCQGKESLIYMANLGCIELNPWNSRIQNLNYPDFCIIDLDPEDIAFDHVMEVAISVHRILDKLGIDNYCKTSGKSGIHVLIPMGALYNYNQVKNFAELLANIIHKQIPDITAVERSPKERQKKVYLDFLQNRKGQTLACPYSLRPAPGMPVSAPLEWRELKKGLDPRDFNAKNILKRLEKKGDVMKPIMGRGVSIEKTIGKLEN